MKHGHAITGHHTPTYKVWVGMRARCNRPQNKGFPHYGGRGIQICERWDDFQNFLDDMGERPSSKHSIDRIDVNGHYEPENCRWVTSKEQSRNTTRTIYLTIEGVIKPAVDWCEQVGLSYDALFYRYQEGWSDYECLHGREPSNTITYKGATKTILEWSEEVGIKYRTLMRRFKDYRWTPEECLFGKSVDDSPKKAILITYKGKTQSMSAWCKELGLHQATVYGRYRKSKDPEVLFQRPRV